MKMGVNDKSYACGLCPICIYKQEPYGISTILYVTVVNQVTPCDVLYKLHKYHQYHPVQVKGLLHPELISDFITYF